jgi:hypothetical protein
MNDKETLTVSQRWTGLLIIAGMLVLFGYLLLHQIEHTGFFTSKFGMWERLALYGPIFISLIAPIVRAVTGQQNSGRPFEAMTNLSLAIGSFWLWIIFPFDFVHLADTLPEALRFVIAWMSNDIGKILLMLQWIVMPVTALFTILKYLSVRRQAVAI